MAGVCASPDARTKKSTSTGRAVSLRSASSAIRVLKSGQPTVCSETCVGRIRYLGVLLYDADAIERAASTENEK